MSRDVCEPVDREVSNIVQLWPNPPAHNVSSTHRKSNILGFEPNDVHHCEIKCRKGSIGGDGITIAVAVAVLFREA